MTDRPNRPPMRRLAWGALLADAPWDGRPRAPEPVRIPATAAARMPTPDRPAPDPTGAPRTRRRLPFGLLLAGAPWVGPPAAAPADEVPAEAAAELLAL